MRILQLNKFYEPWVGGVERVVAQVTQALVAGGHVVDAVVCDPGFRTRREALPGGGQLVRAGSWGVWFSMPVSLLFVWHAWRLGRRVDAVIVHHPNPLAFVALLFVPRRVPVVVWYHADITRQKILGRLFEPLLLWGLRRARAIIVLDASVAAASSVLTRFAAKCVVIPYGLAAQPVPANDAAVLALKQQYPQGLVLSVGRLVPYKGYAHLLQAMVANMASLVIVGDGPLRSQLTQLILALGLSYRVVFVPYVTDAALAAWYAAADVFVLPSVTSAEAFGLVQVEAMAAGCPVINTALPTAVPHVSLHGITGLTVPPADSAALATALQTLLSDPALRQRYGVAGQQRVAEEFSFPAFSNRLLAVITRL